MLTTFATQIRATLRQPAPLFWALAFPLILATMFSVMFGSISEAYTLQAQPVGIVRDADWEDTPGAEALAEALGAGDRPLIEPVRADDLDAALAALTDGSAIGYLYADDDHLLRFAVSDAVYGSSDNAVALTVSVIGHTVERYNETAALGDLVALERPQALLDEAFVRDLGAADGLTEETRLTRFAPDGTARYYYALLAMACLMCMTIAIGAITDAQPNLSALGARRNVAPLPRHRMLMAVFLSSWLMSFACMAVAFLAVRYVFGVGVGGREPMAIAAVAAATFMASAFGMLIGAIPRIPAGTKYGVATGITCLLSLFAGLYGEPAMALGDWVQRELPAAALANPARQITQLFYDMLYYDDPQPFIRTLGVLCAMGAACLAGATLLLRRQRYEHL